jgi:hypothetical protein
MQDLVNNVNMNTNCAIATNVQRQSDCGIGVLLALIIIFHFKMNLYYKLVKLLTQVDNILEMLFHEEMQIYWQ